MRAFFLRLLHTTCASLLGLGITGHAYAAVLPFTGSLSVVVVELSGGTLPPSPLILPPITTPGTGSATVSGTNLTNFSISAGAFSLPFISIPVTDFLAAPIVGVEAKNVKNGAGSFNLGGKMAVQGSQFYCIGGVSCSKALANLTVPFTSGGKNGVGLGGAPVFAFNSAAAIGITVNGNPWVATTAKVGTVTAMGFVHGPASGGAATAGQASGVIQLVTPTLISTTIGAFGELPSVGILNLHFVPEPSTFLLLTSGVVGLGMIGRGRMRK